MIVEEKKRKRSRFSRLSFRSLASKISLDLYSNYQKFFTTLSLATTSRLLKSVKKYRIASLLSHAALAAQRGALKREDYSPEVATLELDYHDH